MAFQILGNSNYICQNLGVKHYNIWNIVYWTNKVRDQTFTMQFLENIELLVKNISIIKVIHFVSFVRLNQFLLTFYHFGF